MKDYRAKLDYLRWGEQTDETVKACEQIVKEAQQLNDTQLEYDARCVYMRAVTFNDEPEKALACFPWLLNERDKHPEKYNYRELLWFYKWVINDITLFSFISKQKILSLLFDMEKRYLSAGYSQSTITIYKQLIYQELGELSLAKQYYNEWLTMTRDDLSDCKACVIDQEVAYFLIQGEYEKSIEKAKDVLSKKFTCKSVPDVTYTKVLLSYCYLNKLEKGVSHYQNAMKLYNLNEEHIDEFGILLTYLGVTKNFIKGKKVFIKQFPFALASKCEYYQYEFYLGAFIFLKALLLNNKTEIPIPKKINLPITNNSHVYQTLDICQFIEEKLTTLTKKFNYRNGNDYFSQNNEKQIELLKNAREVNLN